MLRPLAKAWRELLVPCLFAATTGFRVRHLLGVSPPLSHSTGQKGGAIVGKPRFKSRTARPGAGNRSSTSVWKQLMGEPRAMQVTRALLGVIAVVALSFFPGDRGDQGFARELAAHGATSTTTASRVHVHLSSGKGGGYLVDDADAHLPGRSSPVRLRGLMGPAHDGDIDFAREQEGWQKPTASSGYASPVQVRYDLRGTGTVDAMTQQDLEYWIQSGAAQIDLGISSFAALLLLASLAPALVRARRAHRRSL